MTTTTDYRRKGNLWLFNQMYGFTSFPNGEDFRSVGKAALICAKGDGTLAPAERDEQISYFSALGTPESVLKELEVYEANDDLAQLLANSSDRIKNLVQRDVVYQAIQASAADGELSEPEQNKISQMAELLGVTSEVVQQLVELHKEEEQLRQKRIKLLYPNGTPY
ncbi:TerB family tellurite resistance protein [Coleofasciculus sp.]|uniref:TerB family tellurite resistance protein n=1 Tax=Coleofasciculus sp. TaxID=3100458 RepID=UPI0039F9D937